MIGQVWPCHHLQRNMGKVVSTGFSTRCDSGFLTRSGRRLVAHRAQISGGLFAISIEHSSHPVYRSRGSGTAMILRVFHDKSKYVRRLHREPRGYSLGTRIQESDAHFHFLSLKKGSIWRLVREVRLQLGAKGCRSVHSIYADDIRLGLGVHLRCQHKAASLECKYHF